jgi:hypothetical protein
MKFIPVETLEQVIKVAMAEAPASAHADTVQ